MSPERPAYPGWDGVERNENDGSVEHQEPKRESREYGENDIIVPDDELAKAEQRLRSAGIAFSSHSLSAKEKLNPEGTAWRPGEYRLTLSRAGSSEPLGHKEMLEALDILRSGADPVTVRLAKLPDDKAQS
jgi:hypothetical protein